MKRNQDLRRAAEIENQKDAVLLGLESLTWLAAWIMLPIWLAARGAGAGQFLSYSVMAAALLALGVLADRGEAFDDVKHLLWFVALIFLAILLTGGAVFFATHLAFRVGA